MRTLLAADVGGTKTVCGLYGAGERRPDPLVVEPAVAHCALFGDCECSVGGRDHGGPVRCEHSGLRRPARL